MKKFLKNQIKSILTVSSNKKGITFEKIKDSFSYEYHKDKIELLLNEDKDIIKIKQNSDKNKDSFVYCLTDEYMKSKKFLDIERKLYNLDYLYSMFKEEEIINIYKLIKDNDKITYQQIVNYLLSIYNLKKDIKQVSHYVLILIKLNQILPYQPVIVEKRNKTNIIGNAYLKFLKENSNSFMQNNDGNYVKKDTITNNNLNTFQLMTKSFIIDDSEIKNSIMFHLYLNKEKEGITANELYFNCDFIKRSKILNKIITYMENESTITHKALRKGKIMEFLYHITDEKKIPFRIKFLVDYYKQIINKYLLNEKNENEKHNNIKSKNKETEENNKEIKNIKKEEIKIDKLLNSKDDNDLDNKPEIIKLDEENEEKISDKKIELESEVLNQEDYNFILTKMKENNKKIIQQSEDPNSMRKNIINYLLSIEKNKNVPLSSYNRYVFILNILYEKKVLSFVEIKHHISNELEKNKNFIIDRKTIRRLLTTLEKIGLIKIVRYELTMRNLIHKYLNSKEEIKQEKIIVVHRDVDINNKLFHHQANEKLRTNKKIENKYNIDDKENKKIKEQNKKSKNQSLNKILNKVIDKNNEMIQINLKEKLFIPIYNILKKIENKNKIDIKKAHEEFMQRLKRNFCNSKYIFNLYDKKDKENEIINKYRNDNLIENYYEKNNYTYFDLLKEESLNYSNIIIPKYIKNKYNNNDSENIFIENILDEKNNLINNEFENPLYSIKLKYLKNENNISFKEEEKEKEEKNKSLIGNKRYRENILKDSFIDNKNFNRKIAINEIMDILCNLPGINFRTLRKMMHVNSQFFCLEKNIINYMVNLGLIYAQDFDQKHGEIVEDTKLFPCSDINLYI